MRKVRKQKLPKSIELISQRTGVVKEFKTDHAIRILRLQTQIGLGTYTLYNTELYKYYEGSIVRQDPDRSTSTGQQPNGGESGE